MSRAKSKPLPFAPWPREWNGGPAQPLGLPCLDVTFEVVTRAEANQRGFFKALSRKKNQDAALERALSEALVSQPIPSAGPWCVRLTRLSPATLDDDNLVSAFKRLRDQIAKVIGIDDRSPCVAFCVAQQRAKPANVRVEVWGPGALPKD
jgi:hypothetical protein